MEVKTIEAETDEIKQFKTNKNGKIIQDNDKCWYQHRRLKAIENISNQGWSKRANEGKQLKAKQLEVID